MGQTRNTHQWEGSKWQDPKDSGQTSANQMCCLPLLRLPSAMAPFLCSLTSDVCWHYPLKSPVTHWTPSSTAFLQTLHAPKLSVQAIMDEVSFLLLPSDRVSFLARSLCVLSLLMALCLQPQALPPAPGAQPERTIEVIILWKSPRTFKLSF